MIAIAIPKKLACYAVAFRLTALLVGLSISVGYAAVATAQSSGDFQPYPVRNVSVDDIKDTVERLLPPGSEIASDARNSRLWVRGSAEAHYIAREAIASLDRAKTQPIAPTGAVQPVFTHYKSLPGEQVEVTADRLQREFGGLSGVQIICDGRTSQILVMAPPEIQGRISARLAQTGPPTAVAQPTVTATARWPLPPSVAPNMRQPARVQQVQLRNSTAERVESMLVDMLRERISPVNGNVPGAVAYQLRAAAGMLSLSVDRSARIMTIEGPGDGVTSCVQLIQILDAAQQSADDSTHVVALGTARPAAVRKTINAIRASTVSHDRPGSVSSVQAASAPLVSMLYQQADQSADGTVADGPAAGDQQGVIQQFDIQPGSPVGQSAGLIGPVQIELLEGLDTLVIRGHKQDVEQVIQMIEQIEQISIEAEPSIEVYHLRNVDCEALSTLVTQLYTEVFLLRQSAVSITALVKPNALLLIGRPESVETVVDLVKRLDRPVAPETQFQVFRLKHAPAVTTAETITSFYEEREALGTKLLVIPDARSNSLIVQASPRDMQEVAAMVSQIDTDEVQAVNELKVFQLHNLLAEELADTLETAISGAAGGDADERSTVLRFLAVDTNGQKLLRSGVLNNVQITPDARANTLLVSAPAESMPLIEALITKLDQLPAAEAQIKVFTIVNSDASTMVDMLETLFGDGSGAGEPAIQTAAVDEDSSLVPLRFAVDVWTNSIIASGTVGDLSVVEAILLRLDETDVRTRQSIVYRLKNAPAEDVAAAINEYLDSERQVVDVTTDLKSPFEQIEQEVVVVAEPVSNSLIVSATPEYFQQIQRIVEQLDERPAMVMIQVLIAEVELDNADEFGVELGLQDSLLFNRGLLENLLTTTETVYDNVTGLPTSSNQTIQSATLTPGFLFNNTDLGNSGSSQAQATAPLVGTQGLSHFDLGRINTELGFGGLVLSASSEAVSVMIRALQETRRLEILSRPQVMTMDNQPAFILVGEKVPRVTGTNVTDGGIQQNTIDLEDVGLLIGVTPRISPDGLVVMEVDAQNSELGPEAEGIPISIAPNGETIRSPRIRTIQTQTTVSAMDGQTIILGGLITKSTNEIHRRVPLLADVPVLGNLFRYDFNQSERKELLIILTPHVVRNENETELMNQVEAARMSWCINDVMEMMDSSNLRNRHDEWQDSETSVIYPDLNAAGEPLPIGEPSEVIPTPGESPMRIEPIPSDMPHAGAMNGTRPESNEVEQADYRSRHPAMGTPRQGPIVSSVQPGNYTGPANQRAVGPQPGAEINPLRDQQSR